jgi:zinc transport system substrate-binding protein
MFRLFAATLAISSVLLVISGCSGSSTKQPSDLPVALTTIYPLYDFTRIIAGDRMKVVMLLPPGAEAHHYEPRPEDMALMHRSALFVYTGTGMEPWAARLLKGVDREKLKVVSAGAGVPLIDGDDDHQHGKDPHIWLDLANAQRMVDNISQALMAADQPNSQLYRQNAGRLKERLAALDQRYKTTLSSCKSRVLFHGGHASMGYLARRYSLEYVPATGIGAETEPSPADLARMIKGLKKSGATAVFSEELVSSRVADALAREAGGIRVIPLSAAHNLSSQDLSSGISFESIMESNLNNLKAGLGCR